MFIKINKFLNNLYSYSGYIAAFFLILVAVFILIGISSRIFGFYIRGLAEYSGYCMAASSFFALSYTFVEGGHIRITLFLEKDDTELTEAQTHINLIQKSYRKLESAQYAARELENDFRDLINVHIQQKGGDTNLQYTLNTDTGTLEVAKPPETQQSNNGAQPGSPNSQEQKRPSAEELDPTGNFKFGDSDVDKV